MKSFNRYSKYKAIRVSHAGYSFASKLEAELFDLLKLMEKAGEVSNIKVQQTVYLSRARIRYIADFSAWDNKLNEMVYFEAKGFETPEWRLKLNLYKNYGPCKLRIYRGKRHLIEEITPSYHEVSDA